MVVCIVNTSQLEAVDGISGLRAYKCGPSYDCTWFGYMPRYLGTCHRGSFLD